EFFPERTGMLRIDADDQDRLAELEKFVGDFDDLFGRLAGAKNNFWKIFAESAVRIHLGKSEISHQSSLKCLQDAFARNFSGAKLVQQASSLGCCHAKDNASANTRCHAGKPDWRLNAATRAEACR